MEGQRRQVVERKEDSPIRVIGCLQCPTYHPGTVDDDDIRSSLMFSPGDDVDQARDLYDEPGFFAAFAHRGAGWILIKVDKPGGKRPLALARAQSPADEKHPALL